MVFVKSTFVTTLGWSGPVICKLNFIRGKFSCTFFPVHRIAFSLEEKKEFDLKSCKCICKIKVNSV